MATEPHTDGCAVSAQCSTEELCRGAARKLSNYQTLNAEQRDLGETIELGSREEDKAAVNANSSSGSPTSITAAHDPPPSVPVAEAGLQIPLERGDTAVSFIIPPPPPSSPGDALADQSGQELTQVYDTCVPHPREAPLPHPPYSPYVALNPLLYQNLAVVPFAVVAAAPPPAASVQTSQPPPTQVTNLNKTDVHQNTANTNVVVENNINLGLERYPSYICFSVTMLLLCPFLNPLALICAIPAAICSCIACSVQTYDSGKVPGKCALACNILALVSGIVSFILIVMPGIIVAVLIRLGFIVVNNLLTAAADTAFTMEATEATSGPDLGGDNWY